jgi:hypothetical protein
MRLCKRSKAAFKSDSTVPVWEGKTMSNDQPPLTMSGSEPPFQKLFDRQKAYFATDVTKSY